MALGELEQTVLLALAALQGEAHGAAIAIEMEARVGRTAAPGALYTVLDRLETKGLVESWIGDSSPARGGRRRRVYRLLPAGAQELRDWYEGIRHIARVALPTLDAMLEGTG